MTKEELQNRVAILEEDNRRLGEQEKELRKDISKVLGNYAFKKDPYSHRNEKELVIYSWAQIFAEIGKLLTTTRESTNAEYIERQEERLRNIEGSIENLFNNNYEKTNPYTTPPTLT